MDTGKISVKLYMEKGHDVDPEEWFKTFNTWISTHQGPDVLIDVADYSHVPAGPVTLLVGHEYDISIDDSDEQRGLLYNRKRLAEGDFAQRLTDTLRNACKTCKRIETHPELGDQVSFRANEVRLVLNDRLNAPNTEETLNAIQDDLNALLNKLYDGADVTVSRRENPDLRFTLDIKADGEWSVDKLLASL